MALLFLILGSFSEARELPTKFASCTVCHGSNGKSESRDYPNLAAQRAGYLSDSLQAFRNLSRNDPDAQIYMQKEATDLTDEDIRQIAEYFSKLPPVVESSPENPSLIAAGREIFFKGIPARQVPSCVHCHGLGGQGVKAIPRLAGQHTTYLAKQLLWFRSGERRDDSMISVVKNLTRDEIEALANYLESI